MTWHLGLYHFFSSIIFSWRDIAEIIFFSSIIYYVSLWLKKDKQKHLLLYFYSYCTLMLSMYHAQLPTATFFLFITAPIACVIFVLIHQETLQKNFVMLRSIKPAHIAHHDWLETLMRSCLVAANNNKKVHCVIEVNDSLHTIIHAPCNIHADIQKDLLSMLLESDSFDQDKFIWLNAQGKLLGMNASWNSQPQQEWLNESAKTYTQWQHDALFFTQKTDALIISISPSNRLFSIVTQSKLFTDITAPHALKTIEKYLNTSSTNQKEQTYEKRSQKPSYEQPRS